MKTPNTSLCIALALALGTATPAFADRGYSHERHSGPPPHYSHERYRPPHHEHHRGGSGWVAPVAILAIAGLAAAAFSQSHPARAPEPAPVMPAPNNYWHYCGSAGQYYPYVRHCPEGWQLVPAR
ncbi:MAG TPA: hypothetical protein PLS67_01840 [Accumulibacter sp.]|jgi:hypothetical protein|nr:hypothetical protein [Accumulibacter sp.]HQC79246.1 hypothetical protein [Accumulibacter sp.]